MSDIFGIDVKYGGGPVAAKELLSAASGTIAELEAFEQEVELKRRDDPEYSQVAGRVEAMKADLASRIRDALAVLDNMRRAR
jgi:hypothetical protein